MNCVCVCSLYLPVFDSAEVVATSLCADTTEVVSSERPHINGGVMLIFKPDPDHVDSVVSTSYRIKSCDGEIMSC